jgi:hypothetical protein
VAALLTLIFVIAVNLALGLLPRVDNFAHIGGLISGFLLGFVFFIRPQFAWLNDQRGGGSSVVVGQQPSPVKRKHRTYQYVLWLAAAVLLVVGYVNMTPLVIHQTIIVDFDFVLSFSNISSEHCLLLLQIHRGHCPALPRVQCERPLLVVSVPQLRSHKTLEMQLIPNILHGKKCLRFVLTKLRYICVRTVLLKILVFPWRGRRCNE